MSYINVSVTDIPKWYSSFLKRPIKCCVSWVPVEDKVTVAVGSIKSFNEEAVCDERFNLVETPHAGGVLLWFKDTIVLSKFGGVAPDWTSRLVSFCKRKGLNVSVIGNDVLVDGYKVSGFMSTRVANTGFEHHSIYVSISMDVDAIKRVSTKPMVKPPRGLADYGLSREEVLAALMKEEDAYD